MTEYIQYAPNPTPWHPWNDDVWGRVPASVPGTVTVVQYDNRWTAPVLAYGRALVVTQPGEPGATRGCALAIIDPLQGPQWWVAGEYDSMTVSIAARGQNWTAGPS